MEEIFVPASGMAMEDVLFTEWLKQPGDMVAPGEPVALVETDKSVVELSGTIAGRLSQHLVTAGDRVAAGAAVAYLLEDGETDPTSLAGGGPAKGPDVQAEVASPGLARDSKDGGTPTVLDGSPADGEGESGEKRADGRHRLSPRQRRAEPQRGGAGAAAHSAVPTDISLRSRNREATAALVSESWRAAPHFSVGRELRADGVEEAVQQARAAGSAVTVGDFFVLSLSRALAEVGEKQDVGLAVATEWGVLVPVLRSLEGCTLERMAELRRSAVDRARHRRLSSSDTAPAFATLSNLGPQGVTWFTGVVPLGQVALLTVGEVSLRPAVEGRGLVVAPMFTAVLTVDHRHYDGVDSARLLNAFAERLEDLVRETP